MAVTSLKKDYKYTYSGYCSWSGGMLGNHQRSARFHESCPEPVSPKGSPEAFRSASFCAAVRETEILRSLPCSLRCAPARIRRADEFATGVVQPDISLICDKRKLDNKGFAGTPDLIMEILSPSCHRFHGFTSFSS